MTYTNATMRNTKDSNGYTANRGANSAQVVNGSLLKLTGGTGIELAGAWDSIVGVSATVATFAADNYTVDMLDVLYTPTDSIETILMTISGGTVTAADEGKYYDLAAVSGLTQVVNGASESTSTWQLRLHKYISATQGEFKIVNA